MTPLFRHSFARPALTLAVTLFAVPLMTACKVSRPGRSLQLTFPEGLEVASDEPIDIEIENRAGSVDIRARPDDEAVSVRAWNAFAKNRQDTPEWVSASLDRVDGSTPGSGQLILRVLSAPQRVDAPTVGIRVTVPTLGNVRVVNSAGEVIIRNWTGALDVQNNVSSESGGSVDARTYHDITKDVTVSTRRGNALVSVGKLSSGSVTVRGDLGNNVDLAQTNATNIRDGVRWTGVVGTPAGSKIDIRSEEGSATLRVGREVVPAPESPAAMTQAESGPKVSSPKVKQRGRFRPPVPEIKVPRTIALPASERAGVSVVPMTPPEEPTPEPELQTAPRE